MPPPLTDKQEMLLKKLYFEDKYFVGRDKLFQFLRQNHPDEKISRRQVMEWLKKQEIAQLFAPKYKTKEIQRTVLSAPYKQVGIDLKDMSTREYKGWKWILTGQDLFSKKAYAVPMKDKTAPTVLSAFKKMLKQMERKPSSIRHDNGSEFIDQKFKSFLKQQGIKQVFSKPHTPQSNGQIEGFNRILARAIEMNTVQYDDQDWVSFLPVFIKNYNETFSRITGKTPLDIEEEGQQSQKETKERIKKQKS